jgi:hypothetical protein
VELNTVAREWGESGSLALRLTGQVAVLTGAAWVASLGLGASAVAAFTGRVKVNWARGAQSVAFSVLLIFGALLAWAEWKVPGVRLTYQPERLLALGWALAAAWAGLRVKPWVAPAKATPVERHHRERALYFTLSLAAFLFCLAVALTGWQATRTHGVAWVRDVTQTALIATVLLLVPALISRVWGSGSLLTLASSGLQAVVFGGLACLLRIARWP